jgi:arsenate reductase (glutaredoxin)
MTEPASIEIWLNPACSKCRTAISELDAAGSEYVVRRYLDDPPSPAELSAVLLRLGLEPWDIARPREAAEEGIDLPRDSDHRDAWLTALSAHPRALQRPIITAVDGTTVIGRDQASLDRVIGPPKTQEPKTQEPKTQEPKTREPQRERFGPEPPP